MHPALAGFALHPPLVVLLGVLLFGEFVLAELAVGEAQHLAIANVAVARAAPVVVTWNIWIGRYRERGGR